jgi:hypothetical protein
MPITFDCPACKHRLRSRDGSEGRRVRCPGCKTAAVVPGGLVEVTACPAPVIVLRESPAVIRPAVSAPKRRELIVNQVLIGAGGTRYYRRSIDPSGNSPDRVTESSADELIAQIRKARETISLCVCCWVGATILFVSGLICAASEAPSAVAWALFGFALLSLGLLPWAFWFDRRSRTVRVSYWFDPLGEKIHDALGRLASGLRRSQAIWSIYSQTFHGD